MVSSESGAETGMCDVAVAVQFVFDGVVYLFYIYLGHFPSLGGSRQHKRTTVVREVNARVLGRGLKLVDGNDNERELNQLLFADDTVVVADSERKLCQLVTEFGRVCERRKLRVNVGKSKVMRCTRNEDGARLNAMLNGEALEEVDQFKYLGSVIAANGGVEANVRH